MGDTDVFAGMSLINEFYQPTIGIVPIGDRFTMGARVRRLRLQALLPLQDASCLATTAPSRACSTPTPRSSSAEMSGHHVVVPPVGVPVDV